MAEQLSTDGYLVQPGTLTRWLTTVLLVPQHDVLGCTVAEIGEVEAVAGRPLPLAYKQWLREAGRGVGTGAVADHFRRSFLTYPHVLEVRAMALEALSGWGNAKLLDQAFPFCNWEFWCTHMLDLSKPSADPPVLMLNADAHRVDRQFASFSQFMAREIASLAAEVKRGGRM